MKIHQHLKFENLHFFYSKFKVCALALFVIASIYGLQNGYALLKKQNAEIAAIEKKDQEKIAEVTAWFDTGKKGPENKSWIDISIPFWANKNAPVTVVKKPSGLLPFNTGQTEQYGNYKQIEAWSTVFDPDLSAEIANPERLSMGTLDFSFVIIYLLPILVIILTFNIGGLEKDLNFFNLIRMQNSSKNQWLFSRYLYYYLVIIGVLLLVMLPYAFVSRALPEQSFLFAKIVFMIMLYALAWFVLFYFINKTGKGSADQSIKMVAAWLLFCVLLPGLFHQLVSHKYPAGYMTDFLDANRDKSYKIYDLPADTILKKLYLIQPETAKTLGAKDTVPDQQMMRAATNVMVSNLMKNAGKEVESRNQEKNRFIQLTYWLNPVSFFQNRLNAVCDNDYYAYQRFRQNIQFHIDKKTKEILLDTWNKEVIGKEKYLEYLNPSAD